MCGGLWGGRIELMQWGIRSMVSCFLSPCSVFILLLLSTRFPFYRRFRRRGWIVDNLGYLLHRFIVSI